MDGNVQLRSELAELRTYLAEIQGDGEWGATVDARMGGVDDHDRNL